MIRFSLFGLAFVSYANVGISYFKGKKSPIEISQTCYDRNGCLNLNQRVSINLGLNKQVPLGYLLSVLSQEIHYPILLRCGDENNSCYNIPISYYSKNKPLIQILREIASLTGLYVKLTPEGIVFYRYEEATFYIPLPPFLKDITIEDKGNNNEDFKVVYKRDYLGKLQDKLQALLHSKFAKVSVSEKGFVFVRGTHSEIEAVKRAIEEISKTINREIRLRMNVLLVDVSKGGESGIDWNALLKKSDYFNLAFTGLTNFASQTYMTFTAQGSTITQFILKLNQLKGNVKMISSNEFVLLNGQPLYFAPQTKQRIISKYELSYIQVGTTTTTTATTQPTLTVDTEDLESGVKLLLVPYYIDKRKIAIDFVRKYSQIDDIVEKTVNLQGYQNQIALPKITSIVNTGQSVLRPGETLLLVSNEITSEKLKKEGIPFLQDLPLLGKLFSYQKAEKRKFRVIITITFEGE